MGEKKYGFFMNNKPEFIQFQADFVGRWLMVFDMEPETHVSQEGMVSY